MRRFSVHSRYTFFTLWLKREPLLRRSWENNAIFYFSIIFVAAFPESAVNEDIHRIQDHAIQRVLCYFPKAPTPPPLHRAPIITGEGGGCRGGPGNLNTITLTSLIRLGSCPRFLSSLCCGPLSLPYQSEWMKEGRQEQNIYQIAKKSDHSPFSLFVSSSRFFSLLNFSK